MGKGEGREGGKTVSVLRLLPCLSRSFGPALAGREGGRKGEVVEEEEEEEEGGWGRERRGF